MKKILSVFLAGTLAMSFASCDKNKSNNEPINEGTTTAMRFVVSEAQTRTLTDGQANADGQGAESKVKNGLFLTLGANNEVATKTLVSITEEGFKEKTWTSEVVKYTGTTGKQRATLILNAPASAKKEITDADQVIEINKLSELTSKDGFTMTGTTVKGENTINIQKNVKVGEVAEGNNQFPFTVERVVSKVQFSMPSKSVNLEGDLELLDSNVFSNIRYAVAGSADKVYLFADHAGARTLEDDMYKDFESAIHKNAAATGENAREGVAKVSDKNLVALFGGVTEDENNWAEFNSLTLAEGSDYQTKSQEAGIFFLENSLDKEIKGKGQLNYNDITYVKVYATFAPDKVWKWEGGKLGESKVYTAASETTNNYKVEISKDYYEKINAGDNDDLKARLSSEKVGDPEVTKYYLEIHDVPGTFYKGANGKLYYDLLSARADNNPTSMKYVGGKMVWMTPANNQLSEDGSYTMYADTRRNNIYSLSLTSINGLGKNYDPIDPSDPNVEKPNDNPDEPTVDPVVPVDPTETHIRVKATILKWNLVHRGVVLK